MAHPLIVEGLSDAVGFLGGALLSYWIGRLLGFDAMAAGYGGDSIAGIVVVGLGGGIGLKLARAWRAAQVARREESSR